MPRSISPARTRSPSGATGSPYGRRTIRTYGSPGGTWSGPRRGRLGGTARPPGAGPGAGTGAGAGVILRVGGHATALGARGGPGGGVTSIGSGSPSQPSPSQ